MRAALAHDDLLQRVAIRAASDSPDLPSPLTADQVARAEARLGFPLHPLLARLYREVADGGFGPDYRLLPLHGQGVSVVSQYEEQRGASAGAEHPRWPEGVVPIMTYGCAMYAGVDCASDDGQVLLFDPNPYSGGAWDHCWYSDIPSLAAWLEVWLAGTGWFEEDAEERDDVPEPQPWEEAGSRLASATESAL